MQSVQERLIYEIRKVPESLLVEVLDFVLFIQQRYSQSRQEVDQEWQPGFFEEVIGGWEGSKLLREEQPVYEVSGRPSARLRAFHPRINQDLC